MKKQSAGVYLMILAAILEIVTIVFYVINCNTDYFVRMGGVDAGLVGCACLAIVLVVGYVYASNAPGLKVYAGWLPVINGIVMMAAFMIFVNLRAYSMATIMSFEKSEQTMSDLSSAIVGIACALAAILLNIVGAFLKATKETAGND